MPKTDPGQESDPVTEALKEKYFKLASTEEIPNTPKLTKQVDALEAEIRKRNQEITCPS
jgi:hypothetical protein